MSREAWVDTDDLPEDYDGDAIRAQIAREMRFPEIQGLLRELLVVVETAPGLTDDWCELPEADEYEIHRQANQEGLCEKSVPVTCMMCALGNLARSHGHGTYRALVDDLDYGRSLGSVEEAESMGFTELVAREIIEAHNGPQTWTPAKRKESMIRWIQARLIPE